jgi:polyhydroxybutyrate depolymerase
MNAVQDSRARSVRLRLPALAALFLVSVFALAQLVPLTPAPASAAASAAAPTTTPPTTTTSSLVPSGNSSGCLASRLSKPGTTIKYMSAGGDSGGYIQELPSRYTGRTAMPVVMDLHGYDVSAVDMVKITRLGTYGNREGFVTITPQVARPFPYWKTGSTSKDVAFLRGVISRVESTLCVDQNRLFVTGYSNGAIMASVLACVDAAQVAAIAPVSGIANPAACHPSHPVSVVAFHGTADPLVPYTGGLGAAAYRLPLPPGTRGNLSQLLGKNVPQSTKGPSIPQTTATWAKRDDCASTPTTRVYAKDVALISYACPNGATVSLYRIRGGGHTWPGSVVESETKALGATTMAISADKIIWSFFESHPLRP